MSRTCYAKRYVAIVIMTCKPFSSINFLVGVNSGVTVIYATKDHSLHLLYRCVLGQPLVSW